MVGDLEYQEHMLGVNDAIRRESRRKFALAGAISETVNAIDPDVTYMSIHRRAIG
jgi:hypothetical protein